MYELLEEQKQKFSRFQFDHNRCNRDLRGLQGYSLPVPGWVFQHLRKMAFEKLKHYTII